MTKSRLFAVLMLGAMVSACGWNDTKEIDCDEGLEYQNRERAERVVVPEGMDPLNEFAEMPVPNADPDAAPPPAGQCIDMPPPLGST